MEELPFFNSAQNYVITTGIDFWLRERQAQDRHQLMSDAIVKLLEDLKLAVDQNDLPWTVAKRRMQWKSKEDHTCHFCGTDIVDGYESNGRRHFLSDCRPDLVKHEIGPICTWANLEDSRPYQCYAYQDTSKPGIGNAVWTDEHIHFHEDGPM